MRRWAFSAAFSASLLFGAPCVGQEAPESLLPDVFGAPPPEAAPPRQPRPGEAGHDEPGPDDHAPDTGSSGAGVASAPSPSGSTALGPDPLAAPPKAARSLDVVGPLTARIGGYGVRAFAGSDGRFITELLKHIEPPVASRWGHIILRRALLSRVPTPLGVRPADWVAERALLLLRMGEVDGAKLLVDSLPLDSFTPRLYGVASQVHLAAADIPALCPLAPSARGFSKSPFWDTANAICAGIDGDDITAATLFQKVRSRREVAVIDLMLAERVASVTSGQGRGSNVEWEGVETLNAYRFGLAMAGSVEIPDRLIAQPGAALSGWLMRSPGLDISRRAAVAPRAAAFGIASAAELSAIAATQAATLAPGANVDDGSNEMRAAFSGRTAAERIAAMRAIWARGRTPFERYGRMVQTAAAAARIPPDSAQVEDAADLIRSMLSAGFVKSALAWWPVLDNAPSANRLAAWPMLALVDTGGLVDNDPGIARDWYREVRSGDRTAARKAALLGAAMRGLGKSGWNGFARSFDVEAVSGSYAARLSAAARARRRGEVALLVGAGLQSNWTGVSPGQLEIIVAALEKAGFHAEARMIAVEALTRN